MAGLLVVHHSPSRSMGVLVARLLAGARDQEIEGVEVRDVLALAASAEDVLGADGYVLATPANFGYMSGALKHFFDTVYYPCLDAVAGRPYGLWVHGNNDTAGAVSSVRKIVSGLGLVPAAADLEADVFAKYVEKLGFTGASGTIEGVPR